MKIGNLIKVALAAALSLSVFSAAQAEEKKWTHVRIGMEGEFRPWSYVTPDGKLEGFEVDLYKILCDKMGVTCEIVKQPFDGIIPALSIGKFDVIMSGMSATPKREEVIDFSEAYASTGQSFATLKQSPLANLPGLGKIFPLATDEAGALKALEEMKPMLKGHIVGVQAGSIAATFLDKYLKNDITIREYKTTEQHDLDLKAGRVDLIIASRAYIAGAAAKPGNEDIIAVGPRFQGGILGRGSSVGLRKTDPELRDMFSKVIKEVKADGTIKALSEKWFGYDVTPY